MPDSRPPSRLRLKYVLPGAIGVATVLLPLAQVLRYQTAEIQTLAAERATLDPVTQAVTLQRKLLGHRDVADRVLRGRFALEEERRQRQGEVDAALWQLRGTLSAGYWLRALDESGSLAVNWRSLATRVASRQVTAPDSLAQHQLLGEQAVQVMDLVGANAAPGSPTQLALLQARQSLAHERAATRPDLADSDAAAAARAGADALAQALQAQSDTLAAREQALRTRRHWIALAMASLLAIGGWLMLRRNPARPPTPGDDVRRNRGRRATDFAPLESLPAGLAADRRQPAWGRPTAPAELPPR